MNYSCSARSCTLGAKFTAKHCNDRVTYSSSGLVFVLQITSYKGHYNILKQQNKVTNHYRYTYYCPDYTSEFFLIF